MTPTQRVLSFLFGLTLLAIVTPGLYRQIVEQPESRLDHALITIVALVAAAAASFKRSREFVLSNARMVQNVGWAIATVGVTLLVVLIAMAFNDVVLVPPDTGVRISGFTLLIGGLIAVLPSIVRGRFPGT